MSAQHFCSIVQLHLACATETDNIDRNRKLHKATDVALCNQVGRMLQRIGTIAQAAYGDESLFTTWRTAKPSITAGSCTKQNFHLITWLSDPLCLQSDRISLQSDPLSCISSESKSSTVSLRARLNLFLRYARETTVYTSCSP